MVIKTILMLIRINKSPILSLCCFASYSATLMEGWNNFGPTPLPFSWFCSREYIFFVTNVSKGTAFLLQGLTYSDKVKLRHTHSTQVKPDLSLITSNVTLKTSFTWYNATVLNSTSVKPNDDFKTVSTNTADQLSTNLISPNPTQSQNIFLLMIAPLKTSHLLH